MSRFLVFTAVLLFALAGAAGAQTTPGKLTGGIIYVLPDWFKPSLFDLREDVEDARKANKHVLLFLHLDECPYCERMLRESFASGETRKLIQANFDVIGINIRGGQELTWTDGRKYTERSFTRELKAFGTPSLVFLGPKGEIVLKLVGYRDPQALRIGLDYVATKRYASEPFTAYAAARERPATYALRDHPLFEKRADFKGYAKPLAILFEDRGCVECARFHEKTLNHPEVLAELKKFLFVRLDTDSIQTVVDPEGKSVTPAQWAQALELTYRPGLVLYDERRPLVRIDARLYHYHFKERLRYVSGGYYKRQSLGEYGAARRAELMKQGINIDYSE